MNGRDNGSIRGKQKRLGLSLFVGHICSMLMPRIPVCFDTVLHTRKLALSFSIHSWLVTVFVFYPFDSVIVLVTQACMYKKAQSCPRVYAHKGVIIHTRICICVCMCTSMYECYMTGCVCMYICMHACMRENITLSRPCPIATMNTQAWCPENTHT